jgi:ATP-dependent Clp protease ATP-binding subunit ClpA
VGACQKSTCTSRTSSPRRSARPACPSPPSASARWSRDRAAATGDAAVGTGHLLGGLVAEGGNLALQVLRALEIEPERVDRELTLQPLAETAVTEAPGTRCSVPATGALELAVVEATALGHNYVGCEHLLLGLVSEPDGAGGQVLRALGAELRLTRRAVAAALAGYVHLRATQPSQPGAEDGIMAALTALAERVERLEQSR